MKRFNTRGVCVPEKHYMVDVSSKLAKIMELVDQESYFAINRPRQYGKTTILSALKRHFDEVDQSANNQLFLDFLGMLRKKYLLRNEGEDTTFQSVILAGGHDVKTLKLKLRPDDERKYNSPWNIAADFNVDLSFSAAEIATMLTDYQNERQVALDVAALAEQIRFYTSGYPFLVRDWTGGI